MTRMWPMVISRKIKGDCLASVDHIEGERKSIDQMKDIKGTLTAMLQGMQASAVVEEAIVSLLATTMCGERARHSAACLVFLARLASCTVAQATCS